MKLISSKKTKIKFVRLLDHDRVQGRERENPQQGKQPAKHGARNLGGRGLPGKERKGRATPSDRLEKKEGSPNVSKTRRKKKNRLLNSSRSLRSKGGERRL